MAESFDGGSSTLGQGSNLVIGKDSQNFVGLQPRYPVLAGCGQIWILWICLAHLGGVLVPVVEELEE